MRTHWRPQLFAAALIMLSVSGCATDQTSKQTAQDAEETTEVVQNSTTAQTSEAAPTTEANKSVETVDTAEVVEGKASCYCPGFYGNKTTSGDMLEKGTMTAAHSSLPMGTEVKVTRLDTGESVTVEINDRKPFKQGTVIDLAHGAAEALDIDDDGTASVSIEVLD
ncbi:septal ring lytic transglycosylase RlpA family protein [Synechococcus sp. CC9616]|uniref:septal ring lytic transglycosylase RlpA family protein n=1 Tax=Synechococcus sp. CC9616 TaxID=110663 RepID=UPI0004B13BDF|nr:septal ring lytic transglycosylase RlpA family protein [Synechococcus sp. CC9616]